MDFLDPGKVLDQLNLQRDMVAAEFGVGSSGFAFDLARRLPRGLVYAIDVQKAPLSAIKGRTISEKIINIKVVHGDLEKRNGSQLGNGSVDLVVVANVLFEVNQKKEFLEEVARVLKQKGQLILIDWTAQAPQGPAQGRVDSEEIKKLAEGLGLAFRKKLSTGNYHFGLLFEKP